MAELIDKRCPMTSEGTSSKDGVARYIVVERAAQNLLDFPEETSDIRKKLRTDLKVHFGAMSAHQPDKADFLVTKYERVAVNGAFLHLVGDELIADTLPKIRDGESLIPADLPKSPYYYISEVVPQALEEPYHTFMGADLYGLLNAFKRFSEQVGQTPDHPYQPLLSQSSSLHTKYHDLLQEHDPGRMAGADFVVFNRNLAVETAWATMRLLIGRQQVAPKDLSPDELTRRAIGDTDTLSWQASTNRNISARNFSVQLHGSEPIGSETFSELGRALTEVDEHVVFRQGPLRDGPWAEPRSCHGRLPLRTPDPEKRRNAQEFSNLAETSGGQPIQEPNDGTFDNVKVSLIVGAHIARHTIFEHRFRG